jgi:hypothetical protein
LWDTVGILSSGEVHVLSYINGQNHVCPRLFILILFQLLTQVHISFTSSISLYISYIYTVRQENLACK